MVSQCVDETVAACEVEVERNTGDTKTLLPQVSKLREHFAASASYWSVIGE